MIKKLKLRNPPEFFFVCSAGFYREFPELADAQDIVLFVSTEFIVGADFWTVRKDVFVTSACEFHAPDGFCYYGCDATDQLMKKMGNPPKIWTWFEIND